MGMGRERRCRRRLLPDRGVGVVVVGEEEVGAGGLGVGLGVRGAGAAVGAGIARVGVIVEEEAAGEGEGGPMRHGWIFYLVPRPRQLVRLVSRARAQVPVRVRV